MCGIFLGRRKEMKRIVMIVGSLRKESFNRKVAQYIESLIGSRAEVSYLEYGDIPYMDQDTEYPAPSSIERVRKEVGEADGIWFLTPEYNYSYPGVLKNLLDWLSRPVRKGAGRTETAIRGKKATLSGAGGRNATAGARNKLRELLPFIGVEVMDGMETGIALDPVSFQTNTLELTEEVKESLSRQANAFLLFLDK